MARRLAEKASAVPGVRVIQPVQANEVFATLPARAIAPLRERFRFYMWDEPACEVRWVCSWDTTSADVDELAGALRELAV
jgi:threonine aldolase